MPCEVVFDFPMAWNGLTGAGIQIPIPIVLPAMTNEHAAERLDLADQIHPLHAS
jgi:hypothetical protein